MPSLKFQVVSMDPRAYILGYKDFDWSEFDKMLKYIEHEVTNSKVNKVEVTRWNYQNERV
jgi:hypothetical protein